MSLLLSRVCLLVVVLLFASLDYRQAIDVVPWIAFAMAFWGIYPMLGIGLMITKQTKH